MAQRDILSWAHESTHLGDELRDHRATFRRPSNVIPSFEYYEYGISIEKVLGGDRLFLTRPSYDECRSGRSGDL